MIHSHAHTSKLKKKKQKPTNNPKPQSKIPMSTLKVKALSPGQRSHSGQQHDEGELCRMRGNFSPVTFLLLSCPLKVWPEIQVLPPRKKNQIQQTIFRRFSKAKKKKQKTNKPLVAAGPESDWLYSLQPKVDKLHTVSKNKTRSWLWLRSWTPYGQIQT